MITRMPFAAMAATILASVPALAAPAPLTAADALAGTQGEWHGTLQYRDYQSDGWESLPVRIAIADQGDDATTVRTARFDDGPKAGIVVITTVTMVDAAHSMARYAGARRGQPLDQGEARITRFVAGADASHWTMVTEERRQDGDGLALVRETTVRDGDRMITTKDVSTGTGTGAGSWKPRNRTVLERAG